MHEALSVVPAIILLLLAPSGILRCQDSSGTFHGSDTSGIKYGRLSLVTGVTTGFVVGNHIYQQKAWWQGNRAPFHFQNDWDYALNFDKWGHMYATSVVSRLFTRSFEWSGVEERPSVFYGSLLALGYEFYIEIEDGFHTNYGASPGDLFADIVGSMIPVLQTTLPVLKNFNLKWSYYPSTQYLDDIKRGQSRVFTDDYDGQKNWLAVDPHFMMDEETAEKVPRWLGLAGGWAVRDLNGNGGGRIIYYLALDYNFSKIETSSPFLRSLFWVLDLFHWPAPGVSLDNKRIKFGIYF